MGITLPTIQIRQQSARIGMETERGMMEIEQPKSDLSIQTNPLQADIQYNDGTLEIDQSRAWDALAMGSVLRLNDRIYSQARDIALRGIAKIVENGNRMAAIHNGGNPIADIAAEEAFSELGMVYPSEASIDNVDISYTANEPDIRIRPATVSIEFKAHAPQFKYHPSSVRVYLQQRNSLEFIPPQIDYKL
jgi:hypothetical protein